MLENMIAVISIPPSLGKEECSKENKADRINFSPSKL